MTHTPYHPDGTCRFCHTPTQHGGLPHAPACVYANTLHALSASPLTALESAVTLYAEVVLAAVDYWNLSEKILDSNEVTLSWKTKFVFDNVLEKDNTQ